MTHSTQPDTELVDRGPSTLGRVAAEAVANTFSGVGLGLLTGVALWALGCAWPTVATWAAASAIAWAGAINWLRFSQDELANQFTFWRMAREIKEQDAELADAHEKQDALRSENARLERENASLNYEWRKAKASPRTVLVEDLVEPEAKRDARHLVRLWAETGKRPARADVVPNMMTRARWDAAYGELTDAHIIGAEPMTEAQMLHALDVRWASPSPVADGQPGAPTSSAGWAARPPARRMEGA